MVLTTTARGTPAGVKLKNGFTTKVAFLSNATINFWEKSTKPPGIDGGELIEQTTFFNVDVQTFAPRTLFKMTDLTMRAAYDPRLYNALITQINVADQVSLHFSDNSTLDFWGVIKAVDFSECVDGTQPEINIVVGVTNTDPTTGAEVLPNYKSPTGTDI